MALIEAIILGFVQGLTEFIPVSSSAHLRLTGLVLPAAQDPGATFTAITQLGTEVAVVIFFWKDIVNILRKWFLSLGGKVPKQDPDVRMGWLIIIGTIPIVVAGFLLQSYIRDTFRSLWIVAIVLIVFGILLGLVDKKMPTTKTLKELTWSEGLTYGIAQTLALVPGVSRSGATITMGRVLKFERTSAAKFSFLLAIPAVFGSGLYELYNGIQGDVYSPYNGLETAVATIVAFFVGLAVIAFFMKYISRKSFAPFVWYRIILGTILVVLLSLGVITG